jgi:ABC-type Zn2+ transport system substrate-binding protein/surface adhesin
LQPASASVFRSNANAFIRSIDEHMFGAGAVDKFGADKLWTWDTQGVLSEKTGGQIGGWAKTMAPFRGKPIIAYHRSWPYFANRFGLRIVAELEPKPGIEPTPGHTNQVVNIGKQQGVKVIIQEPFYSDKVSKFVAGRIGAKALVLASSVGQDQSTKDYISLFDTNVSRVAAALGN